MQLFGNYLKNQKIMNNKANISDLKSLKLAKVQLKSQILKNELEIQENLINFKESLFDSSESAKDSLLGISSKEISKLLSSFIIAKMIKPKSKLVKKAAIFFSSLIIQKYSSKITHLLGDFLNLKTKEFKNEQIT